MASRIVSLFSILIQALQGILTIKLASGVLEIEQMQVWVLMAGMLPFIALFDFGFTSTVIRELSMSNGHGSARYDSESTGLVKSLLTISILILLGSVLLLMILSCTGLIAYVISFFILSGFLRVISNIFLSMVFVTKGAVFEKGVKIFSTIVYFIAISLCLRFDFGLYSLSLSVFFQALASILLSVVCSFYIYKQVLFSDFDLNKVRKVYPNLRDWTLSSIPSLFVFSSTLYVVAMYLKPEEIVQYSLLYQMFFGVLTVANIPVYLSSPTWSYLFNKKEFSSLNKSILKTIYEVSFLALSGCTFLIFFGSDILNFINSEIFEPSYFVLLVFSLLIYLEAIQTSLTNACFSCRNTNYTLITIVAGVLSVVFSFLGAKYFGLIGAVSGVLVSQSLSCGYFNIRRAIRFFKFHALKVIFVLSTGSFFIILSVLLSCFYFESESFLYLFVSYVFLMFVFVFVFFVSRNFKFNKGGFWCGKKR